VNAQALKLIKEFEGLDLKAYDDGVGVATIGYGTTRWPDGRKVKLGETCTQAQAESMLEGFITKQILPKVSKIPHWGNMSEGQRAALISFAYNLGPNFYGSVGFETISKALRGPDWAAVPKALMLYVNPGTRVEAGLRRRRQAEGKLWAEGSEPVAPPSAAVVASAPEALFKISALQDTWLKKELAPAAELDDKQKVAVAAGKTYEVLGYSEQAMQGHAEVELGHGAGTWFVFEPHWRKGAAAPPARVQTPGGGLAAQQAVVDWADFAARLTPHLTVGEVLQYDKRRTPPAGSSMRGRLLRTAEQFEAVRVGWGRPLGVTSFYRPEPINQQVGGVPGSRHVSGEAFDIYPIGVSLEVFYQWILRRWTGGLGDGRSRGFVHLDTRNGGHFVPGAGARPHVVWTY
jgi:GH24 family phage-related lysozyme (muramidase)